MVFQRVNETNMALFEEWVASSSNLQLDNSRYKNGGVSMENCLVVDTVGICWDDDIQFS